MLPDRLLLEAESLLAACRAKGVRLAMAESCTGGLIAAALTAIAGASDVVDRGFVTYSNESKHDLLGVPTETIARQGQPVASSQHLFPGDRSAVRAATVEHAFALIRNCL